MHFIERMTSGPDNQRSQEGLGLTRARVAPPRRLPCRGRSLQDSHIRFAISGFMSRLRTLQVWMATAVLSTGLESCRL
jgi:hypothetical protein